MCKFLCKNRSWSTCSDASVLRCAVTISPAVEKTLCRDTGARNTQVSFGQLGNQRKYHLILTPPAKRVLGERE